MLMSVSVSAAVLAAITSIAFAAVLPLGLTQPTPRIAAQTKVVCAESCLSGTSVASSDRRSSTMMHGMAFK